MKKNPGLFIPGAFLLLLSVSCKKEAALESPINNKITQVVYNELGLDYSYLLRYQTNNLTQIIGAGADTTNVYYTNGLIDSLKNKYEIYSPVHPVLYRRSVFNYGNNKIENVLMQFENYITANQTCRFYYNGTKIDSINGREYTPGTDGLLGRTGTQKFIYNDDQNLSSVKFYSATGELICEELYEYADQANPLLRLNSNFCSVNTLVLSLFYETALSSHLYIHPNFLASTKKLNNRKIKYPSGLVITETITYEQDNEGKLVAIYFENPAQSTDHNKFLKFYYD